jgi:hypothetical protein
MVAATRVGCPDGHPVMTRARGRSTKCGQCGRTLYVRADGNSRFEVTLVPTASARPRGNPRKPAPAKRAEFPAPPPDDAPESVQQDRELWEFSQPDDDGRPMTVEEIAEQYDLTFAEVRAGIAREVKRQGTVVPANAGKSLSSQIRRGEDFRDAAKRLGMPYKELLAGLDAERKARR